MIGMSICALIDEGTYGSQVLLSLNAYFLCTVVVTAVGSLLFSLHWW